jgi:hypothetical protein
MTPCSRTTGTTGPDCPIIRFSQDLKPIGAPRSRAGQMYVGARGFTR